MVQLRHGVRLFTLWFFLANVAADKDAKKHDLARRRLVYGVHEEPALVLHADESEHEDSFGSFTKDREDEKDWGRLLDSTDTNMSMAIDCMPYKKGSESK